MTRYALVALLLTACGGQQAEPPRASASSTAEAPSLSRVMVELVRGTRSVASVVDRERGLVHVVWRIDASDEDPRRDADGVIRVAERLCGPALDAAVARFDADLRARNQDPTDEPTFTCEGATCRHRPRMEYDVEGAFTFGSAEPPVLERVVQIEGHLTAEADVVARRWAEGELARLEGGRCAE